MELLYFLVLFKYTSAALWCLQYAHTHVRMVLHMQVLAPRKKKVVLVSRKY